MKDAPVKVIPDSPEHKLFEALKGYVDARLEAKLAEMRAGDALLDQRTSPLGPRRHVAFVKRRLEAGDVRCGKAGRRFMATRTAIEEELARLGRTQVEAADDADDERAELLSELGLRVVAGGRSR